jgi:hypothetical protein
MVEIVSAILTERGEAILLIVGKADSSGTLHTPVNTYDLSSPKHWKGLSTPLDVTTSLDQRTTAILQDKAGRLILEHGSLLLRGWTISSDPSLEQDISAFKRSNRREVAINKDLNLSLQTLPNPYAWVSEGRDCNVPSPFLMRVILSLIMEGVILGCMVKKGTLLTAPASVIEDILSSHRPSTNTGIMDLKKLSTTWTSREELNSSVQKWTQEKLSREGAQMGDHTSTTGKRPNMTAGAEEVASDDGDDARMEDLSEATPPDPGGSSVAGSTNETSSSKAPRHV